LNIDLAVAMRLRMGNVGWKRGEGKGNFAMPVGEKQPLVIAVH
jgi:hypothetical protein